MAITKNSGRQDIQFARVTVNLADLASGVAAPAIDVPAGTVYAMGWVDVKTAFDSATSDNLDVGDGDDVDRYTATPIDISATGRTDLDVVGKTYAEKDTVDVIWTGVGTAPTVGSFDLVYGYIREDRAVETQT